MTDARDIPECDADLRTIGVVLTDAYCIAVCLSNGHRACVLCKPVVIASIRSERREQLKLALQLRRDGLTYKEIGILVPVTQKNKYARHDEPHPRSSANVWCFLKEAVITLVPKESQDEVAESLGIGWYSNAQRDIDYTRVYGAQAPIRRRRVGG